MSVKDLMRDNIRALDPYRCARDEFSGSAEVYLDANESWRNYINFEDVNRYPDPHSMAVRELVEEKLGLKKERTIVGNGSDELIDLLFRIFCDPGKDCCLLLPPTYGAYKVFAAINDVKVELCPLKKEEFSLDEDAIIKAIDEKKPKLLFICSPNNPTGNAMNLDAIGRIASHNPAITVVDEAYFEFSDKGSATKIADKNERVVVLRTLSKCWASAGARVGIAYTSEEIHETLYNVKYPYNLSLPSQMTAIKALMQRESVLDGAKYTKKERARLSEELGSLGLKAFPSDSNFLLVRVKGAERVYKELQKMGIIVRNRSKELNCESCLRITVGSKEENDRLLSALGEIL